MISYFWTRLHCVGAIPAIRMMHQLDATEVPYVLYLLYITRCSTHSVPSSLVLEYISKGRVRISRNQVLIDKAGVVELHLKALSSHQAPSESRNDTFRIRYL